jgi:hypothetical protein
MRIAVHILWPVAHIQTCVKEEGLRTGHEVGLVKAALIVERAVRGMGEEHRVFSLGGGWAVGLPGSGLTNQAEKQVCQLHGLA